MKIKKTFIVLLCLMVTICSGCVGKEYSFQRPIDEIASVKIVWAESSLDYSVVKTLSDTEKNDFIKQFQHIKFRSYVGDPPEVYGYSIMIIYEDGNYEMICHFASEYVKNKEVRFLWKMCDESAFQKIIKKFSA